MSHPDPLHDPENELPEDPDLTDVTDLSEIQIGHSEDNEDAIIKINQ